MRDVAIFEMMYSCGLRVTELCNFKLANILWDSEMIRVDGKGGKQRFVPIGPMARKNLKDYIEKERPSFSEKDPKTAYKIGRFAFEEEDWKVSYKYLLEAKNLGYDKYPGRLDLLMGISLYELNNYNKAKSFFNNALEFEDTKISAEGWLKFIDELST